MVQPLFLMKIACESLEWGSLPLPPGSSPCVMLHHLLFIDLFHLHWGIALHSSKLSWTLLKEIILSQKASLVAQMVNNLPAMLKTQVESLGQEDPIE